MDCEWDDGKVFFFFIIMIIKGAVVVSCCSLLLLLLLSVGSCFCCCLWLALFAGQFVKKDNHLKMKMNVEPSWRSLPPATCHLPASLPHLPHNSHVRAICGMQNFHMADRQINSNNSNYNSDYKMPQNTHKA